MIDLEFLTIKRIIVHHIPPRADDKTFVPPVCATTLVKLTNQGLDMFSKRISQALGHHSHGIQVQFHDTGPQSFFANSVDLMDGSNAKFIASSAIVANDLARAQLSKNLTASKLIVISGLTSKKQVPFSAVVKSELQDGLSENQNNGKAIVDYLTNIFFAESQKLYKIGFVQKMNSLGTKKVPEHFAVHLYDHLMTGTETRSAAFYFHSDFLGTEVSSSDRHKTREFFEKTKEFLQAQDITTAEKIELGEALRSELRSNKSTISIKKFSDDYLEKSLQGKYIDFMQKSNVSSHAITKDVEYIKSRLRRRQKIVFNSGVMITTPADKISLVSVEAPSDGTTIVKITGTVESQG
ncbi:MULTISPECIES: nucleoid-associated protein [unclassified Delftia]|uniref:nucleoid-associated protein n=1 Tax=unclassified Delftia TaxID=2613839 RepID=UPI0018FF9B09|nr:MULTISPECIES: nucleoid-associated protein [unclassified Delftia]MBK0115897.1 nucleoid-associated protein [Delftia sp. S65]MBK0121794.1 nucleoid-associated protein [Delftia sp. S67]MBK0133367.1 nucleoid-associated protein [Delftia sp. S66]